MRCQNRSALDSPTPPVTPLRPSSARRLGDVACHAKGHACAWSPNLSNVAFSLRVGHWVLPRRPQCSTRPILPSVSRLPRVDMQSSPVSNMPGQSSTVSPSPNLQPSLHSTGPLLEHAQSQLRLHEPPSCMQGVGLLLSVQRLRGRTTWKCSGQAIKARQDQHR